MFPELAWCGAEKEGLGSTIPGFNSGLHSLLAGGVVGKLLNFSQCGFHQLQHGDRGSPYHKG